MRQTIRIAVVDDHPLFREGVAATLAAGDGFSIVGVGGCCQDAVRLAAELRPDMMLLDINLPGGTGLSAVEHIAVASPATRTVLLTVSEDETHVKLAMQAGASGYIVKGVLGEELSSALRSIHGGTRYVSPGLAARILTQQVSPMPVAVPTEPCERLTSRENEIMHHVSRGLTNKEVARALDLSEKTVKHHMTRIMHKLKVRNRMEVILVASGKHDQAHGRA